MTSPWLERPEDYEAPADPGGPSALELYRRKCRLSAGALTPVGVNEMRFGEHQGARELALEEAAKVADRAAKPNWRKACCQSTADDIAAAIRALAANAGSQGESRRDTLLDAANVVADYFWPGHPLVSKIRTLGEINDPHP